MYKPLPNVLKKVINTFICVAKTAIQGFANKGIYKNKDQVSIDCYALPYRNYTLTVFSFVYCLEL